MICTSKSGISVIGWGVWFVVDLGGMRVQGLIRKIKVLLGLYRPLY